jgi:demethylspheroidene O-methyltransferase
MGDTQPMLARIVLDALDLRGVRTLLDLGGGEGAFVAEVGRRWPDIGLALFDRPPVADLAVTRLGDAVRVTGGDLFEGPLPEVAEVVTLVRICHDHDDERGRALFARLADWLPPDSRLVIAEPMAGGDRAGRAVTAYFNAYFQAMGRGRPRAPGTYAKWLRAAGFRAVRPRTTALPLLVGIVEARSSALSTHGICQFKLTLICVQLD